jgi:hypothetical protein
MESPLDPSASLSIQLTLALSSCSDNRYSKTDYILVLVEAILAVSIPVSIYLSQKSDKTRLELPTSSQHQIHHEATPITPEFTENIFINYTFFYGNGGRQDIPPLYALLLVTLLLFLI